MYVDDKTNATRGPFFGRVPKWLTAKAVSVVVGSCCRSCHVSSVWGRSTSVLTRMNQLVMLTTMYTANAQYDLHLTTIAGRGRDNAQGGCPQSAVWKSSVASGPALINMLNQHCWSSASTLRNPLMRYSPSIHYEQEKMMIMMIQDDAEKTVGNNTSANRDCEQKWHTYKHDKGNFSTGRMRTPHL